MRWRKNEVGGRLQTTVGARLACQRHTRSMLRAFDAPLRWVRETSRPDQKILPSGSTGCEPVV